MLRSLHGAELTHSDSEQHLLFQQKNAKRRGQSTQEQPQIGRYGFLLSELQANPNSFLPLSEKTRNALVELGKTMIDGDKGNLSQQNTSQIPSIYTYFGQFIDHDVTLEHGSGTVSTLIQPDLRPLSAKQISRTLKNLRTRHLDLDSIYSDAALREGDCFKLGNVTRVHGERKPLLRARPFDQSDENDLPRNPIDETHSASDRAAQIGDPRNDENLIISQLHVAFLRAHNRLVAKLGTFEAAKRSLCQHYQHIVIHDFLKRVANPQIVDLILQQGNRVYDWRKQGTVIPLEFSAAAYRFGHSMVRESYDFNRNFNSSGEVGTFAATLDRLFTLRTLNEAAADGKPKALPTLPENWLIEWERFVDGPHNTNKTRRIDTMLAIPLMLRLQNLEGKIEEPPMAANLAIRNLLRGYRLHLPTGQAVARALQKRVGKAWSIPMLTPQQIEQVATRASTAQAEVIRNNDFHKRTPLWYYILAEAEYFENGQRLGPVGSTLVAEVLIGLIRASPNSILTDDSFKPSLPTTTKNQFTLADLLRYAGVLNKEEEEMTIQEDTMSKDATQWDEKWRNVQNAIKDSMQRLPADPTAPYFRCLLGNLLGFADLQVDYFRPLLDRENKYATNIIINQASLDLASIMYAAEQRKVEKFRTRLEVMDRVAKDFVNCLVGDGRGFFQESSGTPATRKDPREPKPIVLTYFQKTKTIRVIPYSPVVLIGLPFSSLGDNAQATQDMLAVAHEVGHLAFWKAYAQNYAPGKSAKFSMFLNRKLREDGYPPWTADGAEQLFADLFTVCTGGPAAAIMAQDKAEVRQMDRVYAEDMRYQILPEARPFIYHHALETFPNLKEKFGDTTYLQSRWYRIRNSDDGRSPFYGKMSDLQDDPEYWEFQLSKAMRYLQPFFANIQMPAELSQQYHDGSANSEPTNGDGYTPWEAYVNGTANPAKQKRANPKLAETNFEELAKKELGEFFVGKDDATGNTGHWNAATWTTWVELLHRELTQLTIAKSETDQYGDPRRNAILYARGWTLESPFNTGPPKI